MKNAAYRPRIVNYKARYWPKTLPIRDSLLEWLSIAEDGLSMADLSSLAGISRQLTVYHTRKLAALGHLVLVLEPSDSANGLRYRCWSQDMLRAKVARSAKRAA